MSAVLFFVYNMKHVLVITPRNYFLEFVSPGVSQTYSDLFKESKYLYVNCKIYLIHCIA